jgi:predicted O-methyltransferase YrrM
VRGIPGFFTEEEGRWYARFARGVPMRGTFVEVGSWKGRSTSFIGRICNGQGARLVCVDHWGGSTDKLAEHYAGVLATEDVEQTFRANMASLGITVEVLREPSVVAAGRFERGSVDRVFLDGSHDGKSVNEDLVAWSERLRPEGTLAGHDYDPKHPELTAAVDAFASARGLHVRRGPRAIFWLER